MKMEVLVQQQYQSQYGGLGSNKVKDWTSTLTPPSAAAAIAVAAAAATNSNPPYLQSNTTNKIRNSINKNKINRSVDATNASSGASAKTRSAAAAQQQQQQQHHNTSYESPTIYANNHHNHHNHSNNNNNNNNNNINNNGAHCDDANAARVNELSLRLLDELRAAKSRHLTCTEVSLPCDLTTRIAAEIIRVSEREPCGTRGCTIYIEFEDEPNNSRRIASLKLDPSTVSTFEVYLTLRQDHRGWTSLLPQFMKSLARTITISPKFTITKHKLYTPHQSGSSYSYGGASVAISTPRATTTTS